MMPFPSLTHIQAYQDDQRNGKVLNRLILSSSQPLQWHRLTQGRELPAKSEQGGQIRPDTTP